jgi:hypothetical protein
VIYELQLLELQIQLMARIQSLLLFLLLTVPLKRPRDTVVDEGDKDIVAKSKSAKVTQMIQYQNLIYLLCLL